TTLSSLDATTGFFPNGALMQATAGAFYGTTNAGGDGGKGGVFRLLAPGQILLGDLTQIYDGTLKEASITTHPPGLAVTVTYTQNGLPATPIDAGTYQVTATLNDSKYQGTVTTTLVIAKAPAAIAVGDLLQTYDGLPKEASTTTTPAGLTGVSL